MIAISYRREDSSPVTGRLYDRLQAEFGKRNVFMDFDSIPFGVDFRDKIKHALQGARVVIAVVGPNWAGSGHAGKRRIDDPTDFVRMEISAALQRGIPVIPVLLDNTTMPSVEELPEELQPFAYRNALVLNTGVDFHHHAGRLITGIQELVDGRPRGQPRRRLLLVGVIVVLALLTAAVLWSRLARRNSPAEVAEQITPTPQTTRVVATNPSAATEPATTPSATTESATTPNAITAEIARTPQERSIANPVLSFTTREAYTANGKNWVRYRYDVLNKAEYPAELFAAAPNLPPCGLNANSSRTWVDFFEEGGKRLYGHCALSKPADLKTIWFALEKGVIPPSNVYIVIHDRQTNTKYKSNLAGTSR